MKARVRRSGDGKSHLRLQTGAVQYHPSLSNVLVLLEYHNYYHCASETLSGIRNSVKYGEIREIVA